MDDWIEYRRDDRELLGWIRLVGESCTIVDLLGREDPTPRDWVQAEEALEERGLRWLAEPYELVGSAAPDGVQAAGTDEPLPVRIVGVSRAGIEVKVEDFGDITAAVPTIRLPFPAPAELRPRTMTAVPLSDRSDG
ncbi:hypothetical protein [Microlunatus soli]|uniref:hypothetical protein n=1 Tax=Microlunatus soli TaxID=630515 RepID=UPI0018D282A8|nr:hypothetical protein [Microlunatus soli]